MDLHNTIEATFIRPPSTQNDVQNADNRPDRNRDEDRGIDNRFDEDLNAELAREAQAQREAQDEALRAAQARRARTGTTGAETDHAAEAQQPAETARPAASNEAEKTTDTSETEEQHTAQDSTDGEGQNSAKDDSKDNEAANAADQDGDGTTEETVQIASPEKQNDAPVSDLAARLAANEALKANPQAAQQATQQATDPAAVAMAQQAQANTLNTNNLQSGITVADPQEMPVQLSPLVMTPGQAALQGNANPNGQAATGGQGQSTGTVTVDLQALMSQDTKGLGDAIRMAAEGQQNNGAQFKLDTAQVTMDTQALGLQAPTNMSAATAATAIKATDAIAPQVDLTSTSNQVSGIDTLRLSSDTATQTQVSRAAPQHFARPPAEQLAMQINKHLDKGVNRFEIKLHPSELGRVEVKMEVGFDGRMQATVAVERAETLTLLQRDSQALERALQEAGLKTDEGSLEFTLKDHGEGSGQGEGNENGLADGSDADIEEVTTDNILNTLRHPLGEGVLNIHV